MAAAIGSMIHASARAADVYPTRPVRLVVPYAAGGLTDQVARLIAKPLAAQLKGTIVVENRPGGATMVGAEAVATAPKDGHTILVAVTNMLCTNPHVMSRIPYKAEDFAPISPISRYAQCIAVTEDVPVKSLRELIAWARAIPDGVPYSSPAIASTPHLMMEGLQQLEPGVTFVNAVYSSEPAALVDLLAGRLKVYSGSVSSVMQHHQAGTMRILAVSSADRVSVIPDVETVGEAGYGSITADSWNSIVAPAGTPETILEKLSASMKVATADREFLEGLPADLRASFMSRTDFASFISAESDRIGALVKTRNIRIRNG